MASQETLRLLQNEVGRLRDENRELKDELNLLRSSLRALSGLQDVAERLTTGTNVVTFLDKVLASALAVVGANDGSLLLQDEATGELVFVVVHGEARSRLTGYRLPRGQGIAGWVAENKKPLLIRDVRQDPRFSPQVDEIFEFQTTSLACVPLVDNNRVLGVIEAVNKTKEREFTAEDHDLLKLVAQLATLAIVRAEGFAETAGPA
jgi:GAF domain-containing protein